MKQSELSPGLAARARAADPDRYLCALFADAPRRGALFALILFNAEIARVREVVSEPMLGQIRLQWWREAIDEIYRGQGRRHEVADPLAAATNIPGARWTFLDEEYQEYGIEGLQVAEKVMTKLSDFLAKRKIGLTVVVYPWPDQIVKRDLDSRQVLFWRDWAERNNAGFLNLFPAFIDQRPAEEVYRKYFIPYDNHFNEQGHEMVAARFLAQFKR